MTGLTDITDALKLRAKELSWAYQIYKHTNSTVTLTLFVTTFFLFSCSQEHHLLQRTLSNNLTAWNPVPSSVLLNSPAEVKS